MPSSVFNKLASILAPYLHTSDNRFRKGIRGEEWIVLALSQLAGSKRFSMSSSDWERGKSTMHKALYRFCDVVNRRLQHHLIVFPKGDAAKRSAEEIQKLCGIPCIVGIVDGTHTPIERPVDN
jgi:hypothetical protein